MPGSRSRSLSLALLLSLLLALAALHAAVRALRSRSSTATATTAFTAPREERAAPAAGPLGGRFPAPPASLTLTFGTVGLKDFVSNWLWHAARVRPRLSYGVIALDDELRRLCDVWGEPAISARRLLAGGPASVDAAFAALGGGYVRDERGKFKQLGYLKALATARLLELGFDVLLSDADAVWLGDPWPWIGSRAGGQPSADAGDLPLADVLASNDMPDLRRDGQPDSVYNSGVAFFRASPGGRGGRARRFALEWANRTLATVPPRARRQPCVHINTRPRVRL